MTGTVKLHGTHADIRVNLRNGNRNATIIPQSRNNTTLTLERDNFDFAAFCASQHDAIIRLTERICERWHEIHPKRKNAIQDDILLAGEWIGSQIQKKPHTAIRDISPRLFVLCSVRIQGSWETIEKYADISDENARLYNISRGGFFRVPFVIERVDESIDETSSTPFTTAATRTFMTEARRLTSEVYTRCPFGASLGIEGPGEGIVWNPAPDQGIPNVSEFWLKTKGEDFEGTRMAPSEKSLKKGRAGKDKMKTFIDRVCHERRFEQGWDYLMEMHVERDKKGIQTFMDWITRDIEIEEVEEITEHGLGTQWKKPVMAVARTWYLHQLEEDVQGEQHVPG
jgi:hypothetical protein